MTHGKVLNIGRLIVPDQLARTIAMQYLTWQQFREEALRRWKEVRDYVYATDTSSTVDRSGLPWANKVTIPKLCQIRDNLLANYEESLFPKRKWLTWLGNSEEDESIEKKEAILEYMNYVIGQKEVRNEFTKMLMDYIDTGNAIVTSEWRDGTIERDDSSKDQIGYTGPVPVRISPYNIVFDPTASDITRTPKIVKSLHTLGEIRKEMNKAQDPGDQEYYNKLFDYLTEIRAEVGRATGFDDEEDTFFQDDGFHSMRDYLTSDYVEVLTFYGDVYDTEKKELLENHIIRIVDRHKILDKRPFPAFFSHVPLYHTGWRKKSENLWGMGPLENILGLQYRLDHLENAKDDLIDMTVIPPLKIKGDVEDFEWGPMARIYTGDDGDVESFKFDSAWNDSNVEIERIQNIMENMAGAPKEAMGFRTPGEKTAFEVQRMENASARIFQHKIKQFERDIIEPWLNSALEMARRNMQPTSLRIFNDDVKAATWRDLNTEDITASGSIKPVAAQHFAEKAQRIQELTAFFSSAWGADPEVKMHFSKVKLALMAEEMLDLKDFNIVSEFIGLTEQADAQRILQANQEQVAVEGETAPELTEDEEPIGTP